MAEASRAQGLDGTSRRHRSVLRRREPREALRLFARALTRRRVAEQQNHLVTEGAHQQAARPEAVTRAAGQTDRVVGHTADCLAGYAGEPFKCRSMNSVTMRFRCLFFAKRPSPAFFYWSPRLPPRRQPFPPSQSWC